jgi:hypothetical protein
MRWVDAKRLEIDGLTFFITPDPADRMMKSTPREFLVVKSRQMVERETSLSAAPPRTIFELGILQAGSAVLMDVLFTPTKLVAIDFNPEPVPALIDYIRQRGRTAALRPYFGVDQGDRTKLKEIIAAEFGGNTIDLVVDDASHFYEETRASFETIFPFVTPGGHYVIEDWAWSHWHRGNTGLWDTAYFSGKLAVTNFISQLAAVAAARPDLIREVTFDTSLMVVTRGDAMIEPDFPFDHYYVSRGRRIEATL